MTGLCVAISRTDHSCSIFLVLFQRKSENQFASLISLDDDMDDIDDDDDDDDDIGTEFLESTEEECGMLCTFHIVLYLSLIFGQTCLIRYFRPRSISC